MKLAILHAGDLENLGLGGVDQYIKNIIRDKNENDITVFGTCVSGKYKLGEEYKVNREGLVYTFVPISDDRRYPLTIYYVFNEFKYLKKICDNDIIYAQRIELSLPFIFNKSGQSKLVQIIHGSSCYTTMHYRKFKSIIYELAEKLSIKLACKTYIVLMRNEFGVPYYKRKYKKYSSKIGYAKIPVNTNIFHSLNKTTCRNILNLSKNDFLIMYGGRVENNPKRVLLLPDIILKLTEKNKNIHLVVVGSGIDLKKLEEKLYSTVDKSKYTIVGYLEDREKYVQYINACDININISEFEGTCTSSLESVACGIPVVSTDTGDIGLFVENGKNGFLVSNESESKIIKESVFALESLMEHRMVMTDDYMQYDCHLVVKELFEEFKALNIK